MLWRTAPLADRPTFVLVDGQEGYLSGDQEFPPDYDGRPAASLRQVREAFCTNVERVLRDRARHGYQVVFVEMDDMGETLPRFRRAAAHASRVVVIQKTLDDVFDPDGDPRMLRRAGKLFDGLRQSSAPIEAGGLNARWCLFRSVRGLTERWHGCSVVARASIDFSDDALCSLGHCRAQNGVGRLSADYAALGELCELDLRDIVPDRSLVDAHLRLAAS